MRLRTKISVAILATFSAYSSCARLGYFYGANDMVMIVMIIMIIKENIICVENNKSYF